MAESKLKNVTRVFIVDDHPIVRAGLTAQIDLQPGFEVCGEAEDIAGALAQIESARPDVAVIDVSLKSGSGIDLVKRLRARFEHLRILVWSMFSEDLYAERALRAGAQGYVHKGNSTREILDAIRAVSVGKIHVSQALAEQLMKRMVGSETTSEQNLVNSLSDRELEMFELLGHGMTTEQIAAKMHVSVKTVETYRLHIKRKLSVDNLPELVKRATLWVLENT